MPPYIAIPFIAWAFVSLGLLQLQVRAIKDGAMDMPGGAIAARPDSPNKSRPINIRTSHSGQSSVRIDL